MPIYLKIEMNASDRYPHFMPLIAIITTKSSTTASFLVTIDKMKFK